MGLRLEPMRRQLAALGVAASWRLGRWDLLDRYLPAAEGAGPELLDGGDRWEVRLGRLLSAVSKGETAAFQEQVRHRLSCSLANSYIKSLHAASLAAGQHICGHDVRKIEHTRLVCAVSCGMCLLQWLFLLCLITRAMSWRGSYDRLQGVLQMVLIGSGYVWSKSNGLCCVVVLTLTLCWRCADGRGTAGDHGALERSQHGILFAGVPAPHAPAHAAGACGRGGAAAGMQSQSCHLCRRRITFLIATVCMQTMHGRDCYHL